MRAHRVGFGVSVRSGVVGVIAGLTSVAALGTFVACGSSSSGGFTGAPTTGNDGGAGDDIGEPSSPDGGHAADGSAITTGDDDGSTIGTGGDDAGDTSAADAVVSCPAGSTLVSTKTACDPALAIDAGLEATLENASMGDVVTVGDTSQVPCIPVLVCKPTAAPSLLFSDSPESPTADGVLYADTVGPANVRMYVYHTNGGSGTRKFSIVALNQGAADAHVVITRKGLADPTTNYVQAGVQAASRWFADSRNDSVVVPAGMRVVIDTELDAAHATNQQLVHEIVDLSLDAQLKVSVVTVASTANAATATAGLSLATADSDHQRGTFPNAERILVGTAPLSRAGAARLALGDGTTEDTLVGNDAVDGNTHPSLEGNFGLVYHARFALAGGGTFAIAPRGGAWGGAGTLVQGTTSTDFALGGTTPVPASGKAGVVAQASSGAVEVDLISAGGSSLPIDLVSYGHP